MRNKVNQLYARAIGGDLDAACSLVDMTYKPIFSYLARTCRNLADAEDLTQITFMKIWSSLENYSYRGRFLAWIHTIAYHVYIDWCRTHKCQQQSVSTIRKEAHTKEAVYLADQREKHVPTNRLEEAVERLDRAKQQVVYLHYFQNMSLRETASILNVATSTVKYRLREALKSLRYELREYNL